MSQVWVVRMEEARHGVQVQRLQLHLEVPQARGSRSLPQLQVQQWDEVPQITVREIIDEEAIDVKRKWVLSRYAAGEGCVEIASALGLPIFTVMDIVKEFTKTEYGPRL